MNNRIEYLSGHRWARQICMSATDELSIPGGIERVLASLRWGLVEKPVDYAAGVREVIMLVEDAQMVRALGDKK